MKQSYLFWLFGVLQSVTLAVIIFLGFDMLNGVTETGVGTDTQVLLSVLFPLFLLIVEYQIYAKK